MKGLNTEKGKEALALIEKTLPQLTEREQEILLSFSEGIAFFKSEQKEKEPA